MALLLKKTFAEKTVNGVQMGNGSLSFQGVKLNVHCFYIDGVLIDTGARSLASYFQPFFQQLGIERVVMTHYHEDHTGGAAFLQEDLGLPLFMNNLMIDYCKKKADYPLYRQLFWGKRRPFQAEPIGETFHSANATWRAIHTPGHAADHLAFLNEETGQLFTGDLYCMERTKVVLREENTQELIDSLKRILTYDFEEVFCSHAGHLNDGRAAVKRKLEYLLNLEGEVVNLYKEGKTPKEIKDMLFPKKYPIILFSLGEWDSIHMIHSFIKQHDKALI